MTWAGFAPDGTRIVGVSTAGTVLVWDTRSRNRPAAVEYIVSKIDQGAKLNAPKEVSKLQKDRKMDGQVRKAVIEMLQAYGGETDPLQEEAWAVVKLPGASPEAYRAALHQAEEAAGLNPSNGLLITTLGVAQYRTGLYSEAVVTLTRVQYFDPPGILVNTAFAAMSHQRLGQTAEAWAGLEKLRGLPHHPVPAEDKVLQGFVSEAESLIAERK